MREIKFRGYAVEEMVNSQWINGFGISELKFAEHHAKAVGRSSDWWIYTESGDYRVEPKSIGQYTGLKDKKGKEIYEGDIIYWEIDNGVGIESYTAIVKWSENLVEEGWDQTYKWLVGYTGNYHRGSYDELSTPAAYNDALQIIGNIYENPELLEVLHD